MRLFTDDGDAVPVTVVDVSNNRVTQVKTQENDGYVALQVTFGSPQSFARDQARSLATLPRRVWKPVKSSRIPRDRQKLLASTPLGAAVPVADVFAVGQRSTCKALPSVRATPVPSSATTWFAACVAR